MLLTPRRRSRTETSEPECRQRRRLLGGLASSAALLHLPVAQANIRPLFGRELKFDHLHTGEKLSTTYWSEGQYVSASLSDINHLLRDFRTAGRFTLPARTAARFRPPASGPARSRRGRR